MTPHNRRAPPGYGLRGAPFNVTVAWQTTPVVGGLHAGSLDFGPHSFPDEYVIPARGAGWH